MNGLIGNVPKQFRDEEETYLSLDGNQIKQTVQIHPIESKEILKQIKNCCSNKSNLFEETNHHKDQLLKNDKLESLIRDNFDKVRLEDFKAEELLEGWIEREGEYNSSVPFRTFIVISDKVLQKVDKIFDKKGIEWKI